MNSGYVILNRNSVPLVVYITGDIGERYSGSTYRCYIRGHVPNTDHNLLPIELRAAAEMHSVRGTSYRIIQNLPSYLISDLNFCGVDGVALGDELLNHAALRVPAAEVSAVRPAPLRHIAAPEAIPVIPASNERQRILEDLHVDNREERVNRLLDPVTTEAIENPRRLAGDPTGQYFEFHTLMALPRARVPADAPEETFVHPLNRARYTEAQVVDASDAYAKLFDETVAEIRREKGVGLSGVKVTI